jgi:IS5 family transposase
MKQIKEQQSFLNYYQNKLWVTRTEKFLNKLDQVVPWKAISKQINIKRDIAEWWVWRPKMETIKMIKILFLQWLYNLSDPETEDQIRDRNSFQKFLWIREIKDIPDETTICRFRNELTNSWTQESIFSMTQFILSSMWFNVEKWYIQDGTIIEAPKWRKNKKWENTRDKDASFTKKNGRSYHWYKAHIETNKDWKFVLNTTYTTAKVHDSQLADILMTWDEWWEAYWDSAYLWKEKIEFLKEVWIKSEFNEKWVRNNPLTPYQKEQNRSKSTIRAKVEHPFATLKARYWNYKAKYRWIVKNAMHWFLACAIYNFELLARRYI